MSPVDVAGAPRQTPPGPRPRGKKVAGGVRRGSTTSATSASSDRAATPSPNDSAAASRPHSWAATPAPITGSEMAT